MCVCVCRRCCVNDWHSLRSPKAAERTRRVTFSRRKIPEVSACNGSRKRPKTTHVLNSIAFGVNNQICTLHQDIEHPHKAPHTGGTVYIAHPYVMYTANKNMRCAVDTMNNLCARLLRSTTPPRELTHEGASTRARAKTPKKETL